MDKQKIVIFSLLILMMACGMALTIFLTSNTGKEIEKPQKPKINQTSEKNPSSKNQDKPDSTVVDDTPKVGKDEDKTKPLKADDIYKRPQKKNNKTVSEQDARRYESSARDMFRDFEFLNGTESLYEAIQTYSEEGNGEKLHILYQDGSMLANLSHSHEEEGAGDEGHVENIDGILTLLSGVRDPEMALLGVLSLSLQERNAIIPSLDSLNPVYEGVIQVVSVEKETGDKLDSLSAMYDVKTLHRILFNVDGYSLVAYVIEDSQGYSHLNSIYEETPGSTNFLTVRKWNDLFNSSMKPKESQPEKPISVPDNNENKNKKEGGK